jgi:hypothetical protein
VDGGTVTLQHASHGTILDVSVTPEKHSQEATTDASLAVVYALVNQPSAVSPTAAAATAAAAAQAKQKEDHHDHDSDDDNDDKEPTIMTDFDIMIKQPRRGIVIGTMVLIKLRPLESSK